MPAGSPTKDLVDARALMVTLDTCIIQQAGYKLSEGALLFLRYQVPKWARLVLSEVVVRELISHQMDPVSRAHEAIQSSLQVLGRKTELDLSAIQQLYASTGLPASAPEAFRGRLNLWLQRFGGHIVPVSGGDLSANVVDRYFDAAAPFGKSERRKSEFPDAFALLSVEAAARSEGKQMVAVSNDAGWKEFAAGSDILFCVASLGELASIFAIEDPRKPTIAQRVELAVNAADSPVHQLLRDELEKQGPALNWEISTAIAGGTVTLETLQVIALRGNVDVERTWTVPDQPNAVRLAIELEVTAEFGVLADLADSDPRADTEYLADTERASIIQNIILAAYLDLDGDVINSAPPNWTTRVEFSKELVQVQLGDISSDDLDASLG